MHQAANLYPVIAALLLDWIARDLTGKWHPVVLFGLMISFMERVMNRGCRIVRLLNGFLSAISLTAAAYGLYNLLMHFMEMLPDVICCLLAAVLIWQLTAFRTLVHEVEAVFTALSREGLAAGRQQLARIVGRETKDLSVEEVRKAALETLAENLSDGVISPLFWFVVGGLPVMAAFKMVSTMDSMIGYRSQRYEAFGKTAARLDDLLNLVPARITAFLLLLSGRRSLGKGLRFIIKYGKKPSSPNAGYPESALAYILRCRFGGPAVYNGKMVNKPYIGDVESSGGIGSSGEQEALRAVKVSYLLLSALVIAAVLVKSYIC